MDAGSSTITSKRGQHVGRMQWPEMTKGHYAVTVTYSLRSPAAIILALAIVRQFLQNPLKNGKKKTKLPSWKL